MQPKSCHKSTRTKDLGFTLIEVLVVVAIIALLISILLPSLNSAREQARLVSCTSNIRQLTLAFQMYASEHRVFPGSSHDFGMDWMGWHNRNKINPTLGGRSPEDGVIYKYMGKMQAAYTCPKDKAPAVLPSNLSTWFSYQYNCLLVMSKPETGAGAHYPKADFDRTDHTYEMRPFDGVPILAESAYVQINSNPGATGSIEGRWLGNNGLTRRHNRVGNDGMATLGFSDGHAGSIRLPGLTPDEKTAGVNPSNPGGSGDWWKSKYFFADAHCVRTVRGKWITARAVNSNCTTRGILESLPPANAGSATYDGSTWTWRAVSHPGDR